MASGTEYKTREDAQAYADEQQKDGKVIEMKDPNGGTYFVVVPKPFDQGKFYKKFRDSDDRLRHPDEEKKNMGGAVVDELGYTQGDMGFTKRGPVKYSKGGAVKGKTFSGIY